MLCCVTVDKTHTHTNLDLLHVVWLLSLRRDRCSHCSSRRSHSHSCHRIVAQANSAGRKWRSWPLALRAGLQSSYVECSCSAWRHRGDGWDQLECEREDEIIPRFYSFPSLKWHFTEINYINVFLAFNKHWNVSYLHWHYHPFCK